MKKQIFGNTSLFLILTLLCAALYFHGDYVSYILSYVFVFIFFLCYIIFTPATQWEKATQITIYGLILAAQIVFTILFIHSDEDYIVMALYRFLGSIFLLAVFPVRQLVLMLENTNYMSPAADEWSALTYEQLKQNKEEITKRIDKIKETGRVISKGYVLEIVMDMPRHSSFSYVNNGTLSDDFFEKAEKTLSDGYIYIVLTRSKSPSSEVIGLFTSNSYNHVSVSFDKDLHTVVSYNGGEKLFPPGLNPELLKTLIRREGSSVLVYRLAASREQKEKMLNKVREINREGSAYNMVGLLLKYSYKPNIMYCSQFVYRLLSIAGLSYFDKGNDSISPADFVELDYYRRLEFVEEISLHDSSKDENDDVKDAEIKNLP